MFSIYSLSKLGNIYHAKQLADYCNKHNIPIKTASLHPGVIYSNFFDEVGSNFCLKICMFLLVPFIWLFTKDTKMGAQTTLHLAYIDYQELHSGDYFLDCKVSTPSKVALNENNQAEFIKFTKDVITSHFIPLPEKIKTYFEDNE
jgi:hypothetical protein